MALCRPWLGREVSAEPPCSSILGLGSSPVEKTRGKGKIIRLLYRQLLAPFNTAGKETHRDHSCVLEKHLPSA